VVFVVLAVLTGVELGVALSAGIPKAAVVVALVALALSKAALIALFYMHLRFETRILRLTVFGPLVAPAVYGMVLIAETAWRHS
jgi:cytochrome c oxidase subunit 4